MNPQTPKPEPSCPCCRALNPIECCNERGGKHDEFSHQCLSCGCLWDQSKVTPAAEPAVAGEAGPVAFPPPLRARFATLEDEIAAGKLDTAAVFTRIRSWFNLGSKKGTYDPITGHENDCLVCGVIIPADSVVCVNHACCKTAANPPAAQPLPTGGVDEGLVDLLVHAFDAGVHWAQSGSSDAGHVAFKKFKDAIVRSRLSRGEGRDGDAWQPIETAPKDAEAIDIWAFTEKQDGEDHRETRLADCYWSAGEGWSCFDSTGGGVPIHLLDWTPTHWRYAPVPPAALASDAAQGKGNG